MKFDTKKSLAIILAAVAVTACSSTDDSSSEDAGPGSASADAPCGCAGSGPGGAASDAARGGAGGSGGAEGGLGDANLVDSGSRETGDRGSEASIAEAGACYDDPVPGELDASREGGSSPCLELPYSDALCTEPDSGIIGGLEPLGFQLCAFLEYDARPGVFGALIDCLGAIDAGDACGEEHDAAVERCLSSILPRACERPVADGGTDPCETVTASCGEIEAADCRKAFNAFTPQGQGIILSCFSAFPTDAGPCDEAFYGCFLPKGLKP